MSVTKIQYEGKEYYYGKEIAILLGYNTPYTMLIKGTRFADGRQGNRPKVSKENILYLPYKCRKEVSFDIAFKGSYFLTEEGVKELIINSQTISLSEKHEVCKSLGLQLDVIPQTFTEVEFMARLKNCLEMLNENLKSTGMVFTLEKQKRILDGKYRVDGFISQCNLCIEYDEASTHYNKLDADIQREAEIKENIKGATFIRVHQFEDDKGINAIINYIYKFVFCRDL